MRLLSITVGGYRNIAETTIELSGITAFVSPNNYGKSNLLDAISYATEFVNESPRSRTAMMGNAGDIPLVPGLADSEFIFRVEFEDPDLGEYRYVRYGFRFAWKKDDGTGQTITDETIEINSKRTGRWTNYLRRSKGQYKKGHSTRSFRSIQLDGNQLAIDVLTAIENIEINPAIKRIKQLGFSLCGSLDASSRFWSTPLEMKTDDDGKTILLDDRDLPRAIYRLRKERPERYDDLLSALYTLFPEFESVSVDPYELKKEEHDRYEKAISASSGDGAEVPFRIRDELYRMTVRSVYLNQPVNVSMMSAGTQRIIWLIANVIIAAAYDNQCIGIEEVETSIHPKMLGTLLELLDENIATTTSLLVTSHSPFLIQYLKPQQIYIGVPSEDGIAKFGRIRKSVVPQVMENAHDHGLGFGEYLFDLMSSDRDGAAVLTRMLGD